MESNDYLILAVVGMPATGKSEVIKKLRHKFNFYHIYYGDVTFEEMNKRGLDINEKNERLVREDLRSGGDLGVYSKMILPKIEEKIIQGQKKILLESMYNIYEYEVIKEKYGKNFKVLAIHTDQHIRLERLKNRKDRRLTEEELISRQVSEAKKLQKGTVISFADFHYINNGESMKYFEKDFELYLKSKILNEDLNSKDFYNWSIVKSVTEQSPRMTIKVGNIYWVNLGLNIGYEEDGKGEEYKRPVLVVQKFSKEIYSVVPITTKAKDGSWYYKISDKRTAILSQQRTLDSKRFVQLDGHVTKNILKEIKQQIVKLLMKE